MFGYIPSRGCLSAARSWSREKPGLGCSFFVGFLFFIFTLNIFFLRIFTGKHYLGAEGIQDQAFQGQAASVQGARRQGDDSKAGAFLFQQWPV